MDPLEDFLPNPTPTAARPLLGQTILVVEDSRFACEALRLMCQRSGARIRRADTLERARRHLRVYRPTVVIVDLGLPDGSGTELIADLSDAVPRVGVILASSGDPGAEELGMEAGADGFLAKPLESLGAFQAAILAHLPDDRQPPGPRAVPSDRIEPDAIGYRDDLAHAAQVLARSETGDVGRDAALGYVTQFLGGVARSAADRDLGAAVARLASRRSAGEPVTGDIARLGALVQDRLQAADPFA